MEWSGTRTEMEWKIKDRNSKREIEQKWNGNGMEMEWRKKRQIKWKQNLIGMEQIWNGNGMENVGEILFCKMDLEMERNGNGMEMELIISSVWN